MSSGELPTGSYQGTVTITGGGTSVTVAVTLTLQGNAIVASPNQLTIRCPAGHMSSLKNVNLTFFQTPAAAALVPSSSYRLLSVAAGSSGTLSDLNLTGAINVGVDATSLQAGTQSYSIAVQCFNTSTCFDTVIAVTVNVTAPPVVTSGSSSGTVGSAFSYQIAATNSPTSYGATGLPAGLTVNTTKRVDLGDATVAGTSSVNLSATSSAGTARHPDSDD